MAVSPLIWAGLDRAALASPAFWLAQAACIALGVLASRSLPAREERLSGSLASLAAALGRSPDLETLAANAIQHCRVLGRGDSCHLCLWEGEDARAWTEAGPGDLHACLMPRHPGADPFTLTDGQPAPFTSCSLVRDRSMAVFPLPGHQSVLGYLVLQRAETPFQLDSPELLMVSAISGHLAAGLENLRLLDELRRKEIIRGNLLGQVISAQEQERKRVARELHDEIGQALAALMIKLELLGDSADPQLKGRLAELRQIADAISEDIHQIIHRLRPSALDDLGLGPALAWLARGRLEPAGIEVETSCDRFDRRLPPETELAVFRIIQEGITNVVRHAGARKVSIRLDADNGRLKAELKDNGRGFHRSQVPEDRLGLAGMEERAHLIGGRLTIASRRGAGTTVRLEVPLKGSDG